MNEEYFIYGIDIIVTISVIYFMTCNWTKAVSRNRDKSYLLVGEIFSTISYAILLSMLWITTLIGMSQVYFALSFIIAFIFLFLSGIIRAMGLTKIELEIKKKIQERKKIEELKGKVKIVERGLNKKKNEKKHKSSTSKRKSSSSRNKQTLKDKRHLHR
jgi:hypothetical protein